MKTLLTDVDGCLSAGRGHPLDLVALSELANVVREQEIRLYLVSGRSQPYLEALSQMLAIDTPMICENGSGIFDPQRDEYTFSVDAGPMDAAKRQLMERFNGDVRIEPGKDFSLSFRLGPSFSFSSISEEYHEVKNALQLPPGLLITHSGSAIDIVSDSAGKHVAVQWLIEQYGLANSTLCGFGDAENDLSFLSSPCTTHYALKYQRLKSENETENCQFFARIAL